MNWLILFRMLIVADILLALLLACKSGTSSSSEESAEWMAGAILTAFVGIVLIRISASNF